MIPITQPTKNTGMSAIGGVHLDPLSSTTEHQAPIWLITRDPGSEFWEPDATHQYNGYYNNSGQHESQYAPVYCTVWHFRKKEKKLFPCDLPKGLAN